MKTVADVVEGFKQWDKPAMVHKTGIRTFPVSYRQLYKQVLQMAGFLESQNLKKGDKILLWGFNSPQWSTVFLAAAIRGIIVVPVDFLAVGEFVEKIQEQVKAKAIFHAEFKIPPSIGIKNFTLEYIDHYLQDIAPSSADPTLTPEDVLEIVFTSGTTGDPKGVVITHKNLISDVVMIKKVVDVRPQQTFLSLLPLSHLFEQNCGFLAPLSSGCTVVYMRGLRPNLIFKVLSEERITNMVIVPRLLKLFETSIRREVETKGKTKTFEKLLRTDTPRFAKRLLFSPVHKKFGLHFESFFSGGAPLSRELEDFWNGLGFRIVQGYGLTECSPVLTVNPLNAYVKGAVGQALPGVDLKLGEKGEVYAKGPNITQEYFEKPAQTKDLFDDGWMKTGDIGEFDEQGYLFLKGRQKDVIVTGAGMNIYPEDIEGAIMHQKGVRDVCVVGLPTSQGEQVHAEVILSGNDNDIKKIINGANGELNDAQQISSHAVWSKDDFPRTTTMKIKKPLVLAEITGRGRGTVMPSQPGSDSKLNNMIAKICDVDIGQVTASATLASDLHLTSVNRIELIALLEQEFNLDLDEDDITATTTVSELEDMVNKRERVHSANIFRRWLLRLPVRIIRGTFNGLLANNLLRLFVRRRLVGLENLDGLDGPAIFIVNHVGYFDAPVVLMSLPWRYRHKIAAAAWKEYFESEGVTWFRNERLKKLQLGFYYEYASLMVNVYPFPKKVGFKRSLEYTGELLDKGWSIMFFPEGEHSPSGQLQPFRSGIGWIAKEMKVPIVPVKHSGFENIMAGDPIQMPRFGRVTIKFGKPIMLDDRKSIPEITQQLQDLIKNL